MVLIDIAGLSPGTHVFVLEPEAEDLNLSSDEYSDLRVDIALDYDPRRVLVHLTVSGTARLVCDRTLVTFDRPVEGSYTILYSNDRELVSENGTYDDAQSLSLHATEIDLTQVIYDTLLLSIPQRRVSPEAEDKEIPYSFGIDEEASDPRWDALKALK